MVKVEKTGSNLVIRVNENVSFLDHVGYIWGSTLDRIRELWSYWELIRNLVMRDLKVRYRNSVLGVLWSLVNPLMMMIVFTVVFTVIAPTANVEKFPVFVLCGILPWNFFSFSVIGSIRSIVDNSPLVSKVYFPREVLPISVVFANLINFLIALIVLFLFILGFQIPLTGWILLLPLVIAVQFIFIVGIGLILATVNVFYRDTQIIMEVVMQAWFFLTPIFYPVEILPRSCEIGGVTIDVFRWMNILNPMASIIATYRVILFGTGYGGAPPEFYFFLRTMLTAVVILVIGAAIFYRYCPAFAEEV